MTAAPPVVLASASPRRAELLRAAGIPFEVRASYVDETLLAGETPDAYVRRLACAKAEVVAAELPGRTVIGADTVVVVDHHILGKPLDGADAARMLRLLSGRRHDVLTGVCVIRRGTPEGPAGDGPAGRGTTATSGTNTRVAVTSVEFAGLGQDEIDWYVASGEPADKAGAYAIQGLASRFIVRIDGSYSNVVGLPVSVVHEMLELAVR